MPTTALPPYSENLAWPEGLSPFQTVDFKIQSNPFPHYAWMRENAPVLRTRTPEADVWYISRFDDVRAAFRAPKVFSSAAVDPVPLVFLTMFDPPQHTRLRSIVASAFAPKAVDAFEEQIHRHANDYLDPLLLAGGGDVVNEFAMRLTMATIGSLLGIPATEFSQLKEWSDDVSEYFGRLARQAPGNSPKDEHGSLEFFEYLAMNLERALIADDGTVGSKVGKLWKEGVLSEREATHFCGFLFLAGHETTTALIGNMFVELISNPELIDRIRVTPSEAPLFVEELARFRGTVQRPGRKTTEDVEIAGTTIPRGSQVRLLPGSANRDEAKFENAGVFDMDRDTTGHLGFGHGIHSCLGAPLARLEGKVALRTMTSRIREMDFLGANPMSFIVGGNLANTGPSHIQARLTPTQK
jgi:cytochrome P450